jgi:hypothetical protein
VTNELQRISIDFATESLEQKLARSSGRSPVTVVIEGVLMYLEESSGRRLLETLHHLFPRHRLICDLMTKEFLRRTPARFTRSSPAWVRRLSSRSTIPKNVFEEGISQLETIPYREGSVIRSRRNPTGRLADSTTNSATRLLNPRLRKVNRTERGSAGSTPSKVVYWKLTRRYRARFCFGVSVVN